MRILPREFYHRDAAQVARDLLGALLVRQRDGREQVGRIVETEAYLGAHDLASHSSKGRTRRNRTMFGPAGRAYVYLIYGLYHCLNAVTGAEGEAAAVLIRALEPIAGLDAPTTGPGRLCRALDIDRRLDGHDLTAAGELFVAEPDGPTPPLEIEAGPRIGVHYAGDWAARPLRFLIRGNRFVSKPVPGGSQRKGRKDRKEEEEKEGER